MDKSVDGYKVVDEYVSDDLASGSEDDKRLSADKCFSTEALTGNILEAPYPVQISSFFAVRLGLCLERQFSL